MLKNIDTRLHEIKGIIAGMHDQLSELADTTNAVYKTVSYHPNEPAGIADDEWDFLDEEA